MTTTAASRADAIAPDDPAADKQFSERQLAKQRETLEELRETRAELEDRLGEVEDEIAERRMAGEDASDLLEEKRELEEEVEWRDRAEPKLARRIRARSLRRLERLAEERLREIKKTCGGLAGEQPRKVERAVEHLEKAREQLRRAGAAFALGRALEEEASILGDVFGLEVPELRSVPSAKSFDELRGAGSTRGWIGWRPERALSTGDSMASGAGRARDEEPAEAIRKLEALDCRSSRRRPTCWSGSRISRRARTVSSSSPGVVLGLAGQWMYSRAALSLVGVTRHMPEGSQFAFPQGGSHSYTKRNAAARDLLDSDYEWLCTLDGDMVHPPRIVPRLLNVDASIVGGLYLLKEPDYTALAGHVPEEHAPEDVPEKRPTDHPDWKVRTLDLRKCGAGGLGICEVDVVGSGAMLVHRRVFEALEPPWFVPNRDDLQTIGQNQDYNLCWRAKRDYGFKVKCDTTMDIEHIGQEGVTIERARDHWRRKVERRRRAAG